MGFMPLLNLRYGDSHGKYRGPFDSDSFTLRDHIRGHEALGRRKLFTLTFNDLFGPLFGRGPQSIAAISRINPLELMITEDLKNGELDLFVAYGGKDEFNVQAQVESFLHVAKERGIDVTVVYDPTGRHDLATGMRLMPHALGWASDRVPKTK
jgi:hypothetical protein